MSRHTLILSRKNYGVAVLILSQHDCFMSRQKSVCVAPLSDPIRLVDLNRFLDARLILFIYLFINFSFIKCRDPNPQPDSNSGSEPEPDLL